MSSRTRSNARALGLGLATNGIVQRMVNLPRNILGGFSRAMHQGIDLIGRRNNHHNQNFHSQQPLSFPFQDPPMVQEEWAFLARYEQQYGPGHPFFYACRFVEALKMARDERKLVFMYIHDPNHPFTPSFCRETLGSEVVVQFLDANFVSWGALCGGGEGLQMAAALGVSGFPFCAVVAPAAGDGLAVLQQMEGPVTPAELLEILQRTMEEQGLAFGIIGRANLEERRQADRGLRAEQDAAYLAALKIDQEKERLQKKSSSHPKPVRSKETSVTKQTNKVSISAETSKKTGSSGSKNGEVTQILIRFPNGERREQSFVCTDKIRAIFGYINSLGLVGDGNYRLISNFPRKVYGFDEMGTSLKDAGLHPKASLFLEIL